MDIGLGCHAVDKCHVIDALRQVREDFGNPAPGLPGTLKSPCGWHYNTRLALEELELPTGIKRLPPSLLKHRLVVIQIN
jgi:hypothetical protein